MKEPGKFYRVFFSVLFFCLTGFLPGQIKPVASFSFNHGSNEDEIAGLKAKLLNVNPTEDRFGNKDNAIAIMGSYYSYINLGTSKTLKPDSGTISLWVKIENKIWSGKGAEYNPILLTKYTQLDDFYEAYAIYYDLGGGSICGVNAQDSTCQVNVTSHDPDVLNTWIHIAIAYNDETFLLYINGNQDRKIQKKFRTKFLESDSVMVGHTANKKNLRFLLGSVDDIQFYDKVLSDAQIRAIYNAPNPNKNVIIFKWVLFFTGLLAFVVALYFYIRRRVKIAVLKEKEKSEQVNTALENELRIHRALMNPHFIFNSLNGLQDFILKNANEEANDYLIKFSQLLRKIMESNMSDSISLELEIELLNRYIEIEGMRFEENIICTFYADPLITPSITIIPIMMLQPFAENAIWHGLLTKEGDKAISISFYPYQEKYLKCVIDDNGIGRKEDNTPNKKKSLAIKFIKQRLELLNKIHNLKCELVIENRPEGPGTRVIIILPILNG